MQRAKAFFYVSLGILALATAFHLGARTAQSQVPGNLEIVGYSGASASYGHVMLSNGDIYHWGGDGNPLYYGNFWGNQPVQSRSTTWGRVKAERR